MDDLRTRLFLRYPAALASRLRVLFYRLAGVHIRGRCALRSIQIPRNPWDIALDSVALDHHVVLLATGPRGPAPRIVLHRGVYINRFAMLDATEQIEVGEDSMIGPHAYLTDHDHGTDPRFGPGEQPMVGRPLRIGRRVWVGAHAVVLKGVTIGDGAVVAAGAVVTRDVPPLALVAGVPARVIRIRSFPPTDAPPA